MTDKNDLILEKVITCPWAEQCLDETGGKLPKFCLRCMGYD